MVSPEKAKKAAEVMQAMAEPTRIRIIECLRAGAKNVSDIAKTLGLEIVNVSHHLGVMRVAGLVTDEKQGRFVSYSLNGEVFTSGKDSLNMQTDWCQISVPNA